MYFFATSAKNAVEGPSHRGLCGLQIAIIPFSLFGFGTFEALSKKRWSADSKKKSGSKKKSTWDSRKCSIDWFNSILSRVLQFQYNNHLPNMMNWVWQYTRCFQIGEPTVFLSDFLTWWAKAAFYLDLSFKNFRNWSEFDHLEFHIKFKSLKIMKNQERVCF